MTPLLQGGIPTPQLARMRVCISAARVSSASCLKKHLCVPTHPLTVPSCEPAHSPGPHVRQTMRAANPAAAVGSVPAAEDVLRGRLKSPARTLFEALRGYPGNRGEADGAVSTPVCLVTADILYPYRSQQSLALSSQPVWRASCYGGHGCRCPLSCFCEDAKYDVICLWGDLLWLVHLETRSSQQLLMRVPAYTDASDIKTSSNGARFISSQDHVLATLCSSLTRPTTTTLLLWAICRYLSSGAPWSGCMRRRVR